MPSIYQLKPAFQNLLRPLVQWLFKRGVTANQVTLFAMFISLALSIFLYLYYLNHPVNWWLLLFPLWMLIRMAFNAIDGMLAREFNQQSNLGAFYNELSDVIADTALYVCLIAFAFIHAKLLLLVAFLAILRRMAHLVEELNLPDFDFFAWDARGHGDSPGERGDAPSFSACVKDIQYFVQHIQQNYAIDPENIAVVAQSWAGLTFAATWVHDINAP
ncbi:hypothetical protein FQR65_LT20086 [Abscondita terminalis]|nr:hypothetical protein FQR65_LT20086 [Abscondita terminalis]